MKCQSLFSWKNKKNVQDVILKFLHSMLIIKEVLYSSHHEQHLFMINNNYCGPSLQQHHLFLKMLPLK